MTAMIILFELMLAVTVACQDITNIDGLTHENQACPGSNVILTCRTIGSTVIAWQSDEYIGHGNNQLGMVTGIHHIGESVTGVNQTMAKLTQDYKDNNGEQILESELYIIVTDYPKPSVTCINNNGSAHTFNFTVLASPDTPQKFVCEQWLCPETCHAHCTLQSPNNSEAASVTGYNVSVNGREFEAFQFNQTNTSSGNGLAGILKLPSCGNHRISVTATNVCGRGPSAMFALNKMSTAPSNVCEPSSPGGGTTSNKYSLEIAIGLIIVVLAVTL